MSKQVIRIAILMTFLLSISCDVDRKTVGDNPPKFAHVSKLSGRKLGHIIMDGTEKKDRGGSFSIFEIPKDQKVGGRLGSEVYSSFVSYMRRISKVLDPVTETQIQTYSLFSRLAEACGITPEPKSPGRGPVVDCDEVGKLPVLPVEYSFCGFDLMQEIPKEPSKESCSCLKKNGNEINRFMKKLDVDEGTLLSFKSEVATCIWRVVDPNEGERKNQSRYWLMGDDRKSDGSKDEYSDAGSRISLVSDENGNIRVFIDLMNLNGVNYTTEDRDYMEPWGKILEAKYDSGKSILTFKLNEIEAKSFKPTGRVLNFKLSQMQPYKSIPNYNAFQGDVIFRRDGADVGKGSAKFSGYMREKLPNGGMDGVWLSFGKNIINHDK